MIQRFDAFVSGITSCYKYIQRIKSLEMTEFGLKGTHVMCMYYLRQNPGGLTASQLCGLCAEDKAAISRSIEYLETNGFIEPRAEKNKRYRTPLRLTEKGKLIGEKLTKKIDGILDLAGNGMTDEERATFYKFLRLIHDNLNSICDSYDRK